MSYVNKGGPVLLCPVGDEFSMIGNTEFAYLESQVSGAFAYLNVISQDIFAMWFSNVRRLRIDYSMTELGSPVEDDSQEISQWKVDFLGGADVPNLDAHPNPKMTLALGVLSTFLNGDEYYQDSGAAGSFSYAFPLLLFKHLGDFYMFIDSLYSTTPVVTITTSVMTLVYTVGDFEITYVYTILETFY